MKCWCGQENPFFAELNEGCDGHGSQPCLCGGDFCVCHNHGEVECPGCPDCESDDEGDKDDFNPDLDEEELTA